MKFSPRWRFTFALASLTLAILAGLRIHQKAASPPSPVQHSEERRVETAGSDSVVSASSPEGSPAAPMSTESPASIASILERIEAAESPVVLAPYLSSGVPEVRVAAVDAMIRLGDSAAVPLLEAAARTFPAEEAIPLLEAARLLALPDASDLPSGKSQAPHDGRKPRTMGIPKREARPAAFRRESQTPPAEQQSSGSAR